MLGGDGARVQRGDVVLEGAVAVALHHGPRGRVRRTGAGIGDGDLRVGDDPGHGGNRADQVDDIAVAEGWHYIVPVKARVRRAEGLELGDVVELRLTVGV